MAKMIKLAPIRGPFDTPRAKTKPLDHDDSTQVTPKYSSVRRFNIIPYSQLTKKEKPSITDASQYSFLKYLESTQSTEVSSSV